jgi:hypothetical protein
VLEPGGAEPNGEGALRYIHAGGIHFYERITAFERPYRMSYLIERARPLPIRHDRGDITLTPEGDATRVVWESEGHIDVPGIGNLLDKLAEPRAGKSFARLLACMERV